MKKIIIDTDNTLGKPFWWNDDGLAILYTLGIPDTDLMGITTVFGNSSVGNVQQCTRRLLSMAGRSDIPLRKGAGNKNDADLVPPVPRRTAGILKALLSLLIPLAVRVVYRKENGYYCQRR